MLLVIIFCPIIAAILIIAGAPARFTALLAASITLLMTLLVCVYYAWWESGFQFVNSFTVSESWRIHFTTGLDGLSLILVLLTAIVTLASVWFTGKIDNNENSFYACLLFMSSGALGAFSSLDLFFFYAFHELALIPTFLLIGIWGSGNRVAAAWKITIYLALGSFILLIGLILLYQSLPRRRAASIFARYRSRLPRIKSHRKRSEIFTCSYSSASAFSFRFFHFTLGPRKLTPQLRRRQRCFMQVS